MEYSFRLDSTPPFLIMSESMYELTPVYIMQVYNILYNKAVQYIISNKVSQFIDCIK